MIYNLSTCDRVHRYEKSVVIEFNGYRKVLSTAPFNGGYKENLKYVFNHDANPGAGIACRLRTNSYEEDMILTATEIGLNPKECTGISTAACMDNLSIKSASHEGVTVTALVTGGIEVNGGRVGDPASYVEHIAKMQKIKEGTINMMIVIDADIPESTMVRAVVTATEAKTAAIQELMAGSNYSRGLATGSGTDGTIVVCNGESSIKLTNAGKHSKLGELIGVAVKEAVKEALYLQTGLSPKSQHSMLKRIKRFGIKENDFWEKYLELCKGHCKKEECKLLDKPNFIDRLHRIDSKGEIVMLTSLFAHLLDQFDWELLQSEDVIQEGSELTIKICSKLGVKIEPHEDKKNFENKEEVIEYLLEKFKTRISYAVGCDESV